MVTFETLTEQEWNRQSKIYPNNISKTEDNRPTEQSFTTWYCSENSIEKTVTQYASDDGSNGKSVSGRTEVCMRNGETYAFETWASWWCGQYGFNASNDGNRIYVISDIPGKGLCCYTKEGKIIWKTRMTSVTDVVVHPDDSVTALTYNGNLVKIDRDGNIVTKRRGFDGRVPRLLSNEIISLCTGDYTLTFLDSYSLEPICKVTFRTLQIEHLHCAAISEKYIVLVGDKRGERINLPGGGHSWERFPVIYLLDRKDNRILYTFDQDFIRENRINNKEDSPVAAHVSLDEDKIVLYQGRQFRKIEITI